MTPIPLEIKQYLRDFLVDRLNESKHQAMPFRQLPAIVIREVELERFLDDMWVDINKAVSVQDAVQDTGQDETHS